MPGDLWPRRCGGSSSPDAFPVDHSLYWPHVRGRYVIQHLTVLYVGTDFGVYHFYPRHNAYLRGRYGQLRYSVRYILQGNVSAKKAWDLWNSMVHNPHPSWRLRSYTLQHIMLRNAEDLLATRRTRCSLKDSRKVSVRPKRWSPKLHCYPPCLVESGAFLCLWFFAECS